MSRKYNVPQKNTSATKNERTNMFDALSLLSDSDDNNDSDNSVKSNTSHRVLKSNKHESNKQESNKHEYNKQESNNHESNKQESNKHESNKQESNKHEYNKHESNKHESNKHKQIDHSEIEHSVQSTEEQKNMYIAPSNGDNWNYVSRKTKKTRPKNEYTKYEKTTKALFDESTAGHDQLDQMGDNICLNSKWTVSIHNTEKEDWTLESYQRIYSFDTVGKYWRLLNNFHILDKINNDIFIMRDGITPIWEDLNNRHGGICSLKIDYYNKIGRNEIGSEIMTCITTLIVNESLLSNNQEINGISYSIRNKSIFIKIWVKDYKKDSAFPSRLPLDFLNKVNKVLQNSDNNRRNLQSRSKISVQYKEIVPEYSM